MLRFRQFIGAEHSIKLREEWKKEDSGSGPEDGHIHHHKAKVGPHTVHVTFDHDPIMGGHGPGEYDMGFNVDGKQSAGAGSKHGVAVFKHVTNVVKEFKAKHKPKSISYYAADSDKKNKARKDSIYGKIAKRLVKNVKHHHTTGSLGGQTYHFSEQWSYEKKHRRRLPDSS